jgi:hypothetical protein
VTPKGGATADETTDDAADLTDTKADDKASAGSGPPRGTSARAAAAKAKAKPKATKRTTVPEGSGRYTPPVPTYKKVSGPWVPVLMFGFWGLGILMIMANYLQFLPGSVSNWYVFGGLGLILAGIVTATQYR